jgi:hypothetical protein
MTGVIAMTTIGAVSSQQAAAANARAVVTDRDTVPGATIFHPADISAAAPSPLIVTGLLGNCSPEGNPEVVDSAAKNFHAPLTQQGFVVLAVGKIDPNASNPVALAAREPATNASTIDPQHIPPGLKKLLDDGWRPWRDALDALEKIAAAAPSPYHGRIDFSRLAPGGFPAVASTR